MVYSVKTVVNYMQEDAKVILSHTIQVLKKHGIKDVEKALPILKEVIELVMPIKKGLVIFGGLGAAFNIGYLAWTALEIYKETRKRFPPPSLPSRGC